MIGRGRPSSDADLAAKGPHPPRWSQALLERVLPPEDALSVLGDLEEGFRARAARNRRVAVRWYRGQALAYALRLGPTRLSTALTLLLHADMIRDLRFALRRLLRQPAFSLVVVVTLALGIGANSAIFSVVDAVLFRPVPVEDPERVVEVYGSSEQDANAGGMFQGFLPVSYPNFEDLRDGVTALDGVFVHTQWPISLTDGDEAERIDGLYVSASYFDILGVRPVIGRTFRPDEDLLPGADAYVVLQHGYWQRRFAGDRAVVGRTVTINARAMEVVGVAPPGFRGTSSTLQPDVFVPVSMIGDVPPWGPLYVRRGLRFFNMGGRLAPGRSLSDARAELEALAVRLAETYPESNRNRGLRVLPLQEAKVGPNQAATLRRTGGALLVVAGLVLLIACMNVANLLLARALSRGGEMAVRTSLGASRGQLVRQLAAESGLLFAAGAGLAVLGAVGVLGAVDGSRPPVFAGGTLDVGLDPRVLGFTLLVTCACAGAFGIVPSLRAARGTAAPALRSRRAGSSVRARMAREGLVLGQVVLSVVALAAAGAFLRSLGAARAIDPGFDIERLGMLQVDLAAQGYGEEEGRVHYRSMVEAAGAVPGVGAAALGAFRPLGPAPLRRVTRVDEDRSQAGSGRYVRVEAVSDGYFETLGIELEQGRSIEAVDRAGTALVAVPNRRMADLLWPEEPPLGQRFHVSLVDDAIEVVGVASTVRTVSLDEADQPVLYVPLEQHHPPSATLFVRLRGDAGLERVRSEVEALDATLPVFGVTTAQAVVAEDLWTARMTARVLGFFGLVGLFLAGVGIYGVVSHSVRERTRELGLRIALGAGRTSVLRTAVGRVLAVVGLGVVAGAAAAVLVLRAFSGILVDGGGSELVTQAVVAAGLLVVAGLAAWLPGHRATSVDPMVVLRGD